MCSYSCRQVSSPLEICKNLCQFKVVNWNTFTDCNGRGSFWLQKIYAILGKTDKSFWCYRSYKYRDFKSTDSGRKEFGERMIRNCCRETEVWAVPLRMSRITLIFQWKESILPKEGHSKCYCLPPAHSFLFCSPSLG